MLITKEDLQKEISEHELQQLSDINAQGLIDEPIIDEAVNDAIAFISSFITIPADPTAYLRSIGVELTLYELRKLHHLQDDEVRKRCEETLIKMARGTIPVTIVEQDEAAASDKKRGTSVFRHGRGAMDLTGFNT